MRLASCLFLLMLFASMFAAMPACDVFGEFRPVVDAATAEGATPAGDDATTSSDAGDGSTLALGICVALMRASDLALVTIDLEQRTFTTGPTVKWEMDARSLGVIGDAVVACNNDSDNTGEGKLVIIQRESGAVEETPRPCESVSADDQGIWVLPKGRAELQLFA